MYQAISTDCAAQRRTRFLYASMSVLNSWAASGLAGLEALGSVNSDWMEVNIVLTVKMGDHLSWMMSKHKVPSL